MTTHQAQHRDPSTLASLTPSQPKELHYRSFRSSSRLHGSHFMTLRRMSRMPESSRDYRPGDPINMIDWKAFARSDQLIVREIRDEAAAKIRLVLDATETMAWPVLGEALPKLVPVTKLEVACRVAFNVAHMHLRMGDLVEIWLLQGDKAKRPHALLKPRSPVDVMTAFERLAAAAFVPQKVASEFVETAYEERLADVGVWVGDGLGEGDHQNFFAEVRRPLFLHVLSSLELDVSWVESDTSYFDEGGQRKEYQGQVLTHRSNYVRHLKRWQSQLQDQMKSKGGTILTLSDGTGIAEYQAQISSFSRGA